MNRTKIETSDIFVWKALNHPCCIVEKRFIPYFIFSETHFFHFGIFVRIVVFGCFSLCSLTIRTKICLCRTVLCYFFNSIHFIPLLNNSHFPFSITKASPTNFFCRYFFKKKSNPNFVLNSTCNSIADYTYRIRFKKDEMFFKHISVYM